MFDFSNYSAKSECYDNLNELVVGKMKDETAGIVIEEFFLIDDNSEHKKTKGLN